QRGMARRELTGVLLVGGESRRFGSPKALARFSGKTFAEQAWGVLGEACAERLAFGKAQDELPLPFPVHDDGTLVRAPLGGVVAGLRAARNEICVVLPVDVPFANAELVRILGEACRDAAVPISETSTSSRFWTKSTYAPAAGGRTSSSVISSSGSFQPGSVP